MGIAFPGSKDWYNSPERAAKLRKEKEARDLRLVAAKGNELRKTTRAELDYKSNRMTAQQRAELGLKARKMSLVDRVDQERNRLFGERTGVYQDENNIKKDKLANDIYQQDFYTADDGTIGRYSNQPHPGRVLFAQMEASKDKKKFFSDLSPEQQQQLQGFRGLESRMAEARGSIPLRPVQAGGRIDTSNWSAKRLRRTQGEFAGAGGRNLDIYDGTGGVPSRFSTSSRAANPNQQIMSRFDENGQQVYTNVQPGNDGVVDAPNVSGYRQAGGAPLGADIGANYNIPREYNPMVSQSPALARVPLGERVRTNAAQVPKMRNESPATFIRRQIPNISDTLNISSTNRDRISGIETRKPKRRKRYTDSINRRTRVNRTAINALRDLGM